MRRRCAPTDRGHSRRAARAAAGPGVRDARRPAAGVRPGDGDRAVRRRRPVRLELARRLGADQCQLAGAVRDAGAARRVGSPAVHRARSGGDGDRRRDAVPDRSAAPRHDRQLHLAFGAARLHRRRRRADRDLLVARTARPAGAARPPARHAPSTSVDELGNVSGGDRRSAWPPSSSRCRCTAPRRACRACWSACSPAPRWPRR